MNDIISSKRSVFVTLFALSVLGAVTYVQHRLVPATAENVIRSFAGKVGLLAVPVLIVLAYRAWAKAVRSELPAWRNGLGLGSIVLLSVSWLFFAALSILGSIRPGSTHFFDLEWTATLFSCTEAAALLAIALRGASRIQAISAALLMWTWVQSTIYF
jgi:hypothetical protein